MRRTQRIGHVAKVYSQTERPMRMISQRRFSRDFTVKVVLEALRGGKTVQMIIERK